MAPFETAFAAPAGEARPTPSARAISLEEYFTAIDTRRFNDAYAIVADLDGPELNAGQRALVAGMQAAALIGMGKLDLAKDRLRKVEQFGATDQRTYRVIIFAAVLSDHIEQAGDALDRMIARFPDYVRKLPKVIVSDVLRGDRLLRKALNDERRIKLVELGFDAGGPYGESLAAGAIDIYVRRGDFVRADALLPEIRDTEYLETMLISRRYEPLWKHIETLAGPNLSRARQKAVDDAARALSEDADNAEQLANLANAYRRAGQIDDAIAFQSKIPADDKGLALADENMGWLINNVALAMHQAGRKADADRLLERLNTAPIEDDYWRVSMKINRLDLLVQDGKFAQALPLIEEAASLDMSQYAEQLIRRLRYCALAGASRRAEAAKLLPELLSHATDAPAATVDGLLCADEVDRAEQLVLEQLSASPDFESDFLRQLQASPLTSSDPSVWDSLWAKLRARPAVRTEFERRGRDIPPQFLPSKTPLQTR